MQVAGQVPTLFMHHRIPRTSTNCVIIIIIIIIIITVLLYYYNNYYTFIFVPRGSGVGNDVFSLRKGIFLHVNYIVKIMVCIE